MLFQSTPPVKAATLCRLRAVHMFCISIHAAREGGDAFGFVHAGKQLTFQSTPPVKAATLYLRYILNCEVFQSTPPVKAATIGNCPVIRRENISIHAAREGGDCLSPCEKGGFINFNPRRP